MPAAEGGGWLWPAAVVAGLLLAALILRLWGQRHGLPYVYNIDENSHFVPKAIELFGHGLNPHYFVNPPADLRPARRVRGVVRRGRRDDPPARRGPHRRLRVARTTVALLGTAAIGLLYGGRPAGRPPRGMLAAALLAVAFLPVFYGHLALNDVPTLAPVCLSLGGDRRHPAHRPPAATTRLVASGSALPPPPSTRAASC